MSKGKSGVAKPTTFAFCLLTFAFCLAPLLRVVSQFDLYAEGVVHRSPGLPRLFAATLGERPTNGSRGSLRSDDSPRAAPGVAKGRQARAMGGNTFGVGMAN